MPGSDAETNLMPQRVLAGRYQLDRLIAQGGMAEVWEGRDAVLARPVAIKVLLAHLASRPGFSERFRREAVAAARLVHPHIVATFDAGTATEGAAGELGFIVMELISGPTLRQVLEQRGQLPAPLAVAIAMQTASALDHAHRAGIIHRDVKPGNILLAEIDPPTVKVTDFGIAKVTEAADDADLTQTGAVIGTAKYLAPEQVEGRPCDARTDVYALGVVLYEMLCGSPPFAAETELATALQHIRTDPEPPRRRVAGIPPALDDAILRAMAKNPDERYPSASAFRAALATVDLSSTGTGGAAVVTSSGGGAGGGAVVASSRGGGGGAGGAAAGGRAATNRAVAPYVERDPTPPAGVEVIRRRPPSWKPLAVGGVLLALVLAAVVAALSIGGSSNSGSRSPSGTTVPAGTGKSITITAAHSFNPQGSGPEHESTAALAIDGDPNTLWTTSMYTNHSFGNLKQGVGLALTLGGTQRLSKLTVNSPTSGWSASVYAAPTAGSALADWGSPVATQANISSGSTTFELKGAQAGAVLLWITDLGPDNQVKIGDISITG